MPENYILVNPFLKGQFKNHFSGKNQLEAASKAYISLSDNFNNNIPNFYFTLQKINKKKFKIGGGKNTDYFHFNVTETKENKNVEFKITKHKINNKGLKEFRNKLEKESKDKKGGFEEGMEQEMEQEMEQDGGRRRRRRRDDDSSSDSDWLDDSSEYKYKHALAYNQPIYSWWYDPYLYRLQNLYVPTFIAPLSPYIYIDLGL